MSLDRSICAKLSAEVAFEQGVVAPDAAFSKTLATELSRADAEAVWEPRSESLMNQQASD